MNQLPQRPVKRGVAFDLRDVLRGLIRDRGFSAVVVLTLALTIGASTAVFAIVNGILLKPLAYDEAHRLVVVNEEVVRVARAFDPEIAIARARPLQQVVDDALASRRYQVAVFIGFAGVGFLIAMVGVYAMTAYGISRRRREMNIRVALGASRPGVVALVVRQAAVPLIAGVGLGVVVSLGASTAVAALLFEMSARDPGIVSGVAALAMMTGIFSSFSAARTGVSVDPAAVLRDE